MNYIFSSQKNIVNFLYGGFCAFTRPEHIRWPSEIRFGEDTYMGQLLFESGYKIQLLNDLEIHHIKNYNIYSFLKHSFLVAFHFNQSLMAKNTISLSHSHATTHQLLSILLTFFIVLSLILGHIYLSMIFLGYWIIHNIQFLFFLGNHLNRTKTLLAMIVTFIDQLIKGLGIASGFIFFGLLHQLKKTNSAHSLSE